MNDWWTKQEDDPLIHITDPVRASLRTFRSHFLSWLAYTSLIVAITEIPWDCGGFWRPWFDEIGASWWPNDHVNFIRGRVLMVAPSILATALACAALIFRPPARVRVAALAALLLSLGWLYLVNFGVHWHAGD